MAEAAQRAEWNRFACLMSLIANANRDPKRQAAFTPADFMPEDRPEKEAAFDRLENDCRKFETRQDASRAARE